MYSLGMKDKLEIAKYLDLEHVHVCLCPAYEWAHHVGLGKCQVDDLDDPVCEECGTPNPTITCVDHGIGSYECWGQRGIHHDYQPETTCCGAGVMSPRTGEECEFPDPPEPDYSDLPEYD